jgi:hypothetical protein
MNHHHELPPALVLSSFALNGCVLKQTAASTIVIDYEFEKVRDHVPSVNINTTAASEHVGEIEQKKRVVKEQARGIIFTLPYKTVP